MSCKTIPETLLSICLLDRGAYVMIESLPLAVNNVKRYILNDQAIKKSPDFSELFFINWCGGMDSNHHKVALASPSSWCVYQFRHHRTMRIFCCHNLPCKKEMFMYNRQPQLSTKKLLFCRSCRSRWCCRSCRSLGRCRSLGCCRCCRSALLGRSSRCCRCLLARHDRRAAAGGGEMGQGQ